MAGGYVDAGGGDFFLLGGMLMEVAQQGGLIAGAAGMVILINLIILISRIDGAANYKNYKNYKIYKIYTIYGSLWVGELPGNPLGRELFFRGLINKV